MGSAVHPPSRQSRCGAAPTRLDDLAAVRRYIEGIDFTRQKAKMADREQGLGWSMDKLDAVEQMYKNYLYLLCKYEDESLPPSADVDDFWHNHILDTHAYHRDTARIFGCYLHHYPYAGLGGGEDYAHHLSAFENTLRRYAAEFGDDLYDIEELVEDGEAA